MIDSSYDISLEKGQTPFDSDESTRIVGTLSRIQELFCENSDFKDGPKSGKVNSDQLKTGKSHH